MMPRRMPSKTGVDSGRWEDYGRLKHESVAASGRLAGRWKPSHLGDSSDVQVTIESPAEPSKWTCMSETGLTLPVRLEKRH